MLFLRVIDPQSLKAEGDILQGELVRRDRRLKRVTKILVQIDFFVFII
jgi:hypothetical protein